MTAQPPQEPPEMPDQAADQAAPRAATGEDQAAATDRHAPAGDVDAAGEPRAAAAPADTGEEPPPPRADGEALPLAQAAAYAGRAPATLRRALRHGKLPRTYRPGRFGPELVFHRADLDAWLADMARRVEDQAAAVQGATAEVQEGGAAPSISTALTPAPVQLYALAAAAYARRLAAVEETAQHQAQRLADARAQADALAEQAERLESRLAALETSHSTPAGEVNTATPSRPGFLARLFGRRE